MHGLEIFYLQKKKQLKSKMSAHKTVAYKQQGSLYAMKLH